MTLNRVLRKIVLGGLFLVPFIPLIVSNFLFFPFISGKNFAFRIIIEIIIAAWLVLALRDADVRPRRSCIFWAVLLFVGVILLADITSIYPYKSFWSNFERMEGFVSLIHLGAYFLVLSSVLRTRELWSAFFHTSIGVSLFASLYAVLQVGGSLAINQGGVRADATFGNAIYLAVFLLFHVFLLAFYALRHPVHEKGRTILTSGIIGFGLYILLYILHIAEKNPLKGGAAITLLIISILGIGGILYFFSRRRALPRGVRIFLYSALALLEIVIILYTATRGVIIGLAGGVLMMGLLMLFPAFRSKDRVARWSAVTLLATFVIAAGLFFAFRDNPAVRQHKIFGRLASISLKNDDAEARFLVWNMAWKGFKERPILGWGQESFNYVFNKYYDPRMYGREQWFDRTHSIVFDWLVAGGILGFLSYLGLFGAALFVIWRRSPHLSHVDKSLLTSLLAAYLFQNIFVFDNLTSYTLFIAILAFIHFESSHTRAPFFSHVEVKTDLVERMYLPIVVVLLAFALYTVNVRPILAGNYLIKGLRPQKNGLDQNIIYFKKGLSYHTFATTEIREQLIQVAMQVAESAQVSNELKQQFFDFARREMEEQVKETPRDARYHLFLGAFLGKFRQYDDALVHLIHAQELSPRKQAITIEIGSNYLNKGDEQKALEIFKEAYERDTRYQDALTIYAVGAIYAKKFDLASELLVKQFGTDLVEDQRIARAYFDRGKYDKVIAIWKKSIEREPKNSQFRLYLAGAYLQNGNKAEAIVEIRKAIELDPSLKDDGENYIKQIESGSV